MIYGGENMKTTLLIGNGLNRCLTNSISWGDLLKKIANDYSVEYNGKIPMPLEFECIVNQYLDSQTELSDKIYMEVKEKIAQTLNRTKLPECAIHHHIKSLGIDTLMTTNYDNLLEYVYNPEYSYRGKKTNKYLFETTSVQKDISFYHIHGHADSPKTICLGYEHYMGLVEKMRSEVNTEEKGTPGKMKIKEALLDPSKRQNTWYERFYTDNIGIIGLGLYESEVDLWWLLTHRAYLYYSNYHGIRKILKNKITYYDILNESNKAEMEEKKKIHYMLKNSHVEVKTYTIGKNCIDYWEAYMKMFESINSGELWNT